MILSFSSLGSKVFFIPLIRRRIWSVFVASLAFLFIVEEIAVH